MDTTLQLVVAPPDQIEVEAVAALFFSDDRPLAGASALLDWRLDGCLTRLLRSGDAVGSPDEKLWIQASKKLRADWVLFLGAGRRAGLTDRKYARQLYCQLLKVADAAGVRRLALALDPSASPEPLLELLLEVKTELHLNHLQCLVTFDQGWVSH